MNEPPANHSDCDTPDPLKPVFRRLALAVNSHGWEDFPSHLTGAAANEILAAWTALWHPDLLGRCSRLPQWQRIDELPEQPQGWLVLVPTFSRSLIDQDQANRFSDLGGQLVTGQQDRASIHADLLQRMAWQTAFEPQVVRDFYSLGYCYLQVQLMTRQLRYSSSLDEDQFCQAVQAALEKGYAGPDDYANAIQNCFDLLREERTRYYPADASLLDLIYLNETTLGERFRRSLNQTHRRSYHAAGDTLDAILQDASLEEPVRKAVQDQQIAWVGGEDRELPGILLSTCSSLREFKAGNRKWNALTGRPPDAYGRRRFGLHVGLPSVLEQFEIANVVHSTLDEGVFPQTSANHIRWEGNDGTVMEALVAPPRLASSGDTWLNLGVRIGENIDVSHYACLLFVRWPGQGHDCFLDLINSNRFGPILGEFVSLGDYFENVADPGYTQQYVADDYRDPYLVQSVRDKQVDPISRFQDYWTDAVALQAASGLAAMAAARRRPAGFESLGSQLAPCFPQRQNLQPTPDAPQPATDLPDLILPVLRGTAPESDDDSPLLVNPFSFSRRCYLAREGISRNHPQVLVSDSQGAVVDMPPAGFIDLSVGNTASKEQGTERRADPGGPHLAEEVYLRNEFFEVEIDEKTGGIGAIKFHGKRTNLLAQQLCWKQTVAGRSRSGSTRSVSSAMQLEHLTISKNSGVQGQITTSGSLLVDQKRVVRFQQVVTVTRGIPVIQVDVDLEPAVLPKGDPWKNHVASRLAWSGDDARLFAWHLETRNPVVRTRIAAPLALEMDQHDFRTALLPHGLPFHQRIGTRKLDSLLIVAGETRRRFRLGIGINLPYPCQSAISQLSPPLAMSGIEGISGSSHAWLFHLNCKNVMALRWEALAGEDGVVVYLKETEGRRVDLTLSCCREFRAARVQRMSAQHVRDLVVETGRVTVPVTAHELLIVALVW